MSDFLKSVVRDYEACVCFSPHLDDAIFSTGGLLSALTTHMPVTIVNAMTTAGDNPHSTLSARAFLAQSKARTPQELYATRLTEEEAAASALGATSVNLGHVDALWRTRANTSQLTHLISAIFPELSALYPTYRRHIASGIINKQDTRLIKNLASEFSQLVKHPTKTLILAPCGIGGHVDHCVVREAASQAFSDGVYYYVDFPYFARPSGENTYATKRRLIAQSYTPDASHKSMLCAYYASQYDIVFQDKSILSSDEQFFHTHS